MSETSLTFHVRPMNCKSCEENIIQALALAPCPFELLSTATNLKTKTLTLVFSHQVEATEVFAWLASVLVNKELAQEKPGLSSLASAAIALFFGLVFLALPYLVLPQLPMLMLGLGVMLWNAWPFFQSAWRQWQTKPRLNMDSLFVLTAGIVILSSVLSFWFPWFAFNLEVGFFIFGFRHLGLEFLAYLDQKMGLNQSMVQRFGHQNYRLEDGSRKLAKDLVKHDRLSLKAGDILPVDARLITIREDARVVDHVPNGAYYPKDLSLGQILDAGSTLESGELLVEVENTLYQSRFQRMDEAVSQFQGKDKKARILQNTQAWLQWFIPGLLIFALSTGLILAQFYSLGLAIQAVISILVSACPCTLGLIIPMAMRMGAFKASHYDIRFKSSKALEYAAETKIVVLDYNGSLTEGNYRLSDFETHAPDAKAIIKAFEKEMLDQRPGQLIGQTIAEHLQSEPELQLKQFSWCKGGVTAFTEQGQWWFGHSELVMDLDLNHLSPKPHHYYLIFQAQSSEEKVLAAQFRMQDMLRTGARQMVENLKAQGKIVRICTGADVSTTQDIMQALGVDAKDIVTNCPLEQKPDYLQQLRQEYPGKLIAMMGDGLNDRAALETADLKIWVKHPKLAAQLQPAMQDSADLVLEGQHIQNLGLAFSIAEQTYTLIHQNLMFSFMYNFLILSLSCGMICILPPALGVCLMILQSALLSLNTYRVLLQPLHDEEKSAKMQNQILQTQTP